MSPTVVSSTKDSDQVTSCKPLEPIHHALMCSYYKVQSVSLQEIFHSVRSKLYNVSSSVRVPHDVCLNSQLLVAVSGVTSQNINDQLLLLSGDFMDDIQRPRQSIDLFDGVQCAPNSSMQTHYFVFNDRRQWKIFKHPIDSVENRLGVTRVLSESDLTLICEAKSLVDPLVFVVPPYQMYLIRVLAL